jgi:hypothetical protein
MSFAFRVMGSDSRIESCNRHRGEVEYEYEYRDAEYE